MKGKRWERRWKRTSFHIAHNIPHVATNQYPLTPRKVYVHLYFIFFLLRENDHQTSRINYTDLLEHAARGIKDKV
jgi:hypothetical protein